MLITTLWQTCLYSECESLETVQQAFDYASYTCSLYVSPRDLVLASVKSTGLTIYSFLSGRQPASYDGRELAHCHGDLGPGEHGSYRPDHRQDPGYLSDRHHRKYPSLSPAACIVD
jgi:hypothetical protein